MILKTLNPSEVEWQGQRLKCSIGRSGIKADKQEGDGATPKGSFRLQKVYYRADRLEKPITSLPSIAIQPNDGWCDDPQDELYNQPVKIPYLASHEKLWREDHCYDLLITTDHNQNPSVPYKGSAIFIHLAKTEKEDNYSPTAGCLGLALADLQRVLLTATQDSVWIV